MGLSGFLVVYLLGGLTFVPLVLGIVFLHGYLTLPVAEEPPPAAAAGDSTGDSAGDSTAAAVDAAFEKLPASLKTRTHVPDVAAGYFAVCREYVPGGINGKPPERTTPAGAVVAAESPSVYQSMYRSIFDRNKTTSPTIEGQGGKSKKARNVFYVVLRLGLLMLYDDSEQLEVRHVISLAHYDVDIYAGGDAIPEGELWIKRNCIRLVQRAHVENGPADSKPFYLFSDNCSEKEDFYHAMLQSQDERTDVPRNPPRPLKFETTDLVRMIQQLHASEENMHTRWINALIGRLFLAMYKTEQVERFIWNKIIKKISRVPKPALISQINLQKVDMGTSPPFIKNPKLRDFTVDGDMTVEADVSYKGNFRVEISAIARIDLGTRFKAREVTLVLATTLKKLEGHILLRMKPPPSNRLWITFETAPKMELSVEPIVSSRQITYGVILRAIESRLREVVSETLVLPNWDDIPFKDTESNPFRGGIWTNDAKKEQSTNSPDAFGEQDIQLGEEDRDSDVEGSDTEVATPTSADVKSNRTPATSSSVDSADTQATTSSAGSSVRPSAKPKAMRSASFASASTPVVNVNAANASATKSELSDRKKDAASSMKDISLSQAGSPTDTPMGSPVRGTERRRSTSPPAFDTVRAEIATAAKRSRANRSSATIDSMESHSSTSSTSHSKSRHQASSSLPRNTFTPNSGTTTNKKQQIFNQSINTATAAAKKWFANRQSASDAPLSLHTKQGTTSSREHIASEGDSTNDDSHSTHLSFTAGSSTTAPLGSPANPIGRGQPIPEGRPESKKSNSGWSVPTAATLAGLTRRKPVPSTSNSQSPRTPTTLETHGLSTSADSEGSEKLPPLPARTPTSASTAKSVGTAAMGHRRKSSASQAPHVLTSGRPSHRKRRSVTESAGSKTDWVKNGDEAGDNALLIMEAPTTDSHLDSPAGLEHKHSEGSIGRGVLHRTRSGDSERDGDVMVVGELEGIGEKDEVTA